MTIDYASTGNSISWSASDTNPNNYFVFKNGSNIKSGYWSSNVDIQVSLDTLNVGVYNFTIIFFDTNNVSISNSVFITVINPAPVLTHPADVTFNAGTSGNKVTWLATDNNPNTFILYRNNVNIANGNWKSSDSITLNLDDLIPGTYNFTLVVSDTAGLKTSDSVLVTVNKPVSAVPTPQITIVSPGDIKYYTYWTNAKLTWKVSYKDGYGNSWNLYVDGKKVDTGVLINNTDYTFNLPTYKLSAGLHNLTFQVFVQDFNSKFYSAKDEVLANVIFEQLIQPGTSDITIGGHTSTNINIDVGKSVNITVVSTNNATTLVSQNALNLLKSSEGLTSTSHFVDITITDTSALKGIWINMSYADWDLQAMNLQESSLKIYFFNVTSGKWQTSSFTGVDTVNKIVYAHVDHLTAFAAVAAPKNSQQSTSTSINTNPYTGPSTTTTEKKNRGIPGFTWFIIVALVFLPIIRKRKLLN